MNAKAHDAWQSLPVPDRAEVVDLLRDGYGIEDIGIKLRRPAALIRVGVRIMAERGLFKRHGFFRRTIQKGQDT